MISCQHVNHSFRNQRVLDNLSWELAPGKIYGLLGKNGAGKSTLLHCLAGLQAPQAGSISIFGHEPRSKSVAFKSDIFLVPEDFYLPELPTSYLLKFYTEAYPTFNKELFSKILHDFEMSDASHWKQMSLGQKKKLLIAFGVAAQTKVLLFDEPTNGLDIPAKEQFNRVLSRILNLQNLIIISTHHVKDVEQMLDHICILDQGQIRVDLPIGELNKTYATTNYLAQASSPIYQENTLTGNKYLVHNHTRTEGAVDIEMFYRAYHRSESKIYFSSKTESHEIF